MKTSTPGSNGHVRGKNDLAALEPYLQEQLDRHFGRSRAIASFDRRLCPYTSSFRIDEVDVRLDDGSRVRLVLKDLSLDSMVEVARRGRPGFLYRPEREIEAYRWILPSAPAGTAMLYDSVKGRPRGRYSLLLERVGGPPLWQVGEVKVWEEAAAWIARFHHAFSPEDSRRLASRAGASVYDEACYWLWLERAQRFAARHPERRRILTQVKRGYGRVVNRLIALPQTLIHGEFYPSNIIIGKRSGVRVCALDWEMVAVGPGLIDLAALTAGWAESTQRTLARAYVAAVHAQGPNGERPARLSRDFLVDLDCARLHLAVRMLGWSDSWEPPRDHAHNWLLEAERLSRRLQRSA